MIGIGLGLALALNISLTTIGLSLWNDSTLRSNVVAEATAIVKQSQQTTTTIAPGTPTTTTTTTTTTTLPANAKCVLPADSTSAGTGSAAGGTAIAGVNCLQGIDLPIGWNSAAWPGFRWFLLLHLLGVLVVGIATSFGAPFWFGILGRLINVRGGGPQPPTGAKQRAGAAKTTASS
jgi:hypothetical protein